MQLGYLDEKKLYKWEKTRRIGRTGFIASRTGIVALVYLIATFLVNKGFSNITLNEIIIFVLFLAVVCYMNISTWAKQENLFFQTIALKKYQKKFSKDGTLR